MEGKRVMVLTEFCLYHQIEFGIMKKNKGNVSLFGIQTENGFVQTLNVIVLYLLSNEGYCFTFLQPAL